MMSSPFAGNSHAPAPPSYLAGKRVLVVEDDYVLAGNLCRGLAELGATVIGPAPTPFYALSLLGRRGVDAAVLDTRLHRTDSFEVAEQLIVRNVPIVFTAESSEETVPLPYRHFPLLQKPVDPLTIQAALYRISLGSAEKRTIVLKSLLTRVEDRLMHAVVRSILM